MPSAISHKVATPTSVGGLRTTLKVETIQCMQKQELCVLAEHFGLGDKWGELRLPVTWFPKSTHGRLANISLRIRLEKYATSQEELDLAITTAVRMLLLCLCSPSKAGRHAPKLLDVTSIASNLSSIWLPLIKKALTITAENNGELLSRLHINDLTHVSYIREANRFENYADRGLWWDRLKRPEIRGIAEESNKAIRRKKLERAASDPFKPLPDTFVHQAGQRAFWITVNLIQPVMDVFEKVIEIGGTARDSKSIRSTRYNRVQKYLESYSWYMPTGDTMERIPFQLNCIGKHNGKPLEWPPRTTGDLVTLLAIGQMAHYFIIALSSGTRASEILSFQTDCLIESKDGISLANGKTYKIVNLIEGKRRDWPMPKIAVQALHNQIRLSGIISRYTSEKINMADTMAISPEPLWRVVGSASIGMPLTGTYNDECRWFIDAIGLTHLLDDKSLTNHRFRKTIARIVALSLAHAPKILMDIFGHESIEMTMNYILADPQVRVEVQEIRRQIVIMMAEKAIRNADSNGGKAAISLRQTAQEIKFRRADDFGAEDEHELAEMLTGQGRYWQLVRPGVICTKLLDQTGPCAKNRSKPNPSRCSTECSYRLEEAENRKQVDETIDDIVRKIQLAWARDDFILAEIWEGQLLAHLKRFDDLFAKWREHPAVMPILQKQNGTTPNVITV